jgi:hypothetical protein
LPSRALIVVLLLAGSGFAVQAAENPHGRNGTESATESVEALKLQADGAVPPSVVPTLAYSHASSPFAGSIFDRPKLTGNWWNARDELLENGMTFDINSTQF